MSHDPDYPIPVSAEPAPLVAVPPPRGRSTGAARRLAVLALAGAAAIGALPAGAAEADPAAAKVAAGAGPSAPVVPGIVVSTVAAPSGVVNLQASATVKAPRDWMSIAFSVTREGADAGAVQAQLRQALEAGVAEARKVARPGQVEVVAGSFSLQPRFDAKTGRMNGWSGTTGMTVQGRDLAGIAQLVGRVGTLTVARLDYGLAPETRERAESEATAQAIARFRAKAGDVARGFGYARHELREVNVQAEQPGGPPPRAYAMKAAAPMADGGLPVEGGDEDVVVTVNGSVQMSR